MQGGRRTEEEGPGQSRGERTHQSGRLASDDPPQQAGQAAS